MLKTIVLSLLTLTTLGTLALPSLADEVNVQDSQQVNTQEGDGNSAFQESSQTIRTNRERNTSDDDAPSNSNYGSVQTIYQDTYQNGTRNSVRQTNVQQIEMRNRNNRR